MAPSDGINYALETQTRPIYPISYFRSLAAGSSVVVHENAHQWFGDSAAVANWRDVWLSEGFATYAEWLWSEAQGEGTAQEIFDTSYAANGAGDSFWQVVIGDPGKDRVFDYAVYSRGAMTLHQLRLAVGDEKFFEILRTWVETRRHGNGSIDDFRALAGKISNQNLDALFEAWLFTAGPPPAYESRHRTTGPHFVESAGTALVGSLARDANEPPAAPLALRLERCSHALRGQGIGRLGHPPCAAHLTAIVLEALAAVVRRQGRTTPA